MQYTSIGGVSVNTEKKGKARKGLGSHLKMREKEITARGTAHLYS
jgi:hypothetical protein